MLPKPDYKRQRRRRRAAIKRADKAFQIAGETHFCSVGHYSIQTTSHHLKGRRHIATRWDRDNTIRLCYAHHEECHRIGPTAFGRKYPRVMSQMCRDPDRKTDGDEAQ